MANLRLAACHANNFALRQAVRALARFPVKEFHRRAGIKGLRRAHAEGVDGSDDDRVAIDKAGDEL